MTSDEQQEQDPTRPSAPRAGWQRRGQRLSALAGQVWARATSRAGTRAAPGSPGGSDPTAGDQGSDGDPEKVLHRADRVFDTIEVVRPDGSVEVSVDAYDRWVQILTVRGLPPIVLDADSD